MRLWRLFKIELSIFSGLMFLLAYAIHYPSVTYLISCTFVISVPLSFLFFSLVEVRIDSQRSLIRQRAALNQLLESSEVFCYVSTELRGLGEQLTIEVIYGHTEKLTGYSKDFWGSSFELLLQKVHPEDRGIFLSVNRISEAGSKKSGVYRFLHANGDYIWLKNHTSVQVCDATGSQHLLGTLCDITSDCEFFYHKSLYELMLEANEFAIAIANSNMGIIKINQKFSQLTRHHMADLQGKSIFHVESQQEGQVHFAKIVETLRPHHTWKGSTQLKTKYNEAIFCTLKVSVVYYGAETRYLWIFKPD